MVAAAGRAACLCPPHFIADGGGVLQMGCLLAADGLGGLRIAHAQLLADVCDVAGDERHLVLLFGEVGRDSLLCVELLLDFVLQLEALELQL